MVLERRYRWEGESRERGGEEEQRAGVGRHGCKSHAGGHTNKDYHDPA